MPNCSSSSSQPPNAPGTHAARSPVPGISSWPSPRTRSIVASAARRPARRGRAARRARRPEDRRQVAARPVQVRLDDLEREARRDGRVEGVAAALEHGHPDARREPVCRRDGTEAAAQLRPRRERHHDVSSAASMSFGVFARARHEVARDEMPVADVDERRLLVVRPRRRLRLERAARAEAAAGRRRERARDVALEHDARARPLHDRIRHDRRREQRLRVRDAAATRTARRVRRRLDDLARGTSPRRGRRGTRPSRGRA